MNIYNLLFVLRLFSTTAVLDNCLSWRLSVETNNIREWDLIPSECADYVSTYINGGQYHLDCDTVANVAIQFAKSVEVKGDGKDIWIFDIDETALSNLPFYARPDVSYGAKPYNWTGLEAWFMEGKAPALEPVLRLYKELVELKYKVVFLTGANTKYEKVKTSNLKKVGYTTWEKLFFKTTDYKGTPTRIFKSQKRKELEATGYRIIGNIGDQWSDLFGESTGRTFKLPNPMYYT